MPYFYFDWTYMVLVLPCIILSLWASSNVKTTFNRYSKQYSSRRITGADAANRVLSANGVTGVRIERVSGNLTDHFDPKTNVIRLSDSVYDSTSTAAALTYVAATAVALSPLLRLLVIFGGSRRRE